MAFNNLWNQEEIYRMYSVVGDAIEEVVTVAFQLPYGKESEILESEEWNRLHALIEEIQKEGNIQPMFPWLHK